MKKSKVFAAFDNVRAEAELKANTIGFLQAQVFDESLQGHEAKQRAPRHPRRLAATLASLAIVLLAGMVAYRAYFTEVAYIDIDTNPSIELSVNRFDRVIGVHAYNDDGLYVLAGAQVMHLPYDEALDNLVKTITDMGYITEGDLLTVTLQTANAQAQSEELSNLHTCVGRTVRANSQAVEYEVFAVDAETKSLASAQNISPARYLVIIELQSLEPDTTIDDCRGQSIPALRQRVHDHNQDGEHSQGRGGSSGASEGAPHEGGGEGAPHDGGGHPGGEGHPDGNSNGHEPEGGSAAPGHIESEPGQHGSSGGSSHGSDSSSHDNPGGTGGSGGAGGSGGSGGAGSHDGGSSNHGSGGGSHGSGHD